jgi:hypothetical protein
VGSALSADPAAPRAPTPRLRPGGVSREAGMMSSSLTDEITTPADPEVHEVSDGICAYVQPDGSEQMVSNQTRPKSAAQLCYTR